MTHPAIIRGGMALYGVLWHVLLPWLKRNHRLQEGWPQRTRVDHLEPADLWIQAASGGEAYLAAALVRALPRDTELRVLVTTLTRQGMAVLEKEVPSEIGAPALKVRTAYFPFDRPGLMGRALKRITPRAMVLLETELWPGLLYQLDQQGIPSLVINGRITHKSVRHYRRLFFAWPFVSPRQILAISHRDAGRFRRLFPCCDIRTMSNIKFDILPLPDPSTTGSTGFSFLDSRTPLTLLASIRQEEEVDVHWILDHLLARFPHRVTALFPRHMHRLTAWQQILKNAGHPFVLRSALSRPAAPGTVILWDVFGELKTACRYADAAFVGGSLKPLGGQNFLEPLMSGVATVTGPYLDNFDWVGKAVFGMPFAIRAEGREAAAQALCRLIRRPPDRQAVVSQTHRFIRRSQGGTRQALAAIMSTLHNRSSHAI